MPPTRRSPGLEARASSTRPSAVVHLNSESDKKIASRSVDWWRVHLFVEPMLAAAGSWPMAGTPAWDALDDDDPVKLAAVLDAAQHHALRVDTSQEALAEASRAVAGSADWASIARLVEQHLAAVRSGRRIERIA